MSTPQKRRDPLCEHVRQLRESLGQTQQEFAQTCKAAIRTVARWETVRPPKGHALGKLELIARQNGKEALASYFRSAQYRDIDLLDDDEERPFISWGVQPTSPAEAMACHAVLNILRDEEYKPLRPQLERLVIAAMPQQMLETYHFSARASDSLYERLNLKTGEVPPLSAEKRSNRRAK